jgi:DNA repair protein SbcC/Rad50
MIPITLTLKGVYSYKEKQTIDFRELASDHLFGIFGTVGSGKSSILEAITFALYGKIERLNTKGLKYNMMNLSSNEMFIDFTFQANNGQYYNSISHFKRNSKKYGDINTGARSCYSLNSNDFEQKTPITSDEFEKVIGLSYDNFKRTIIIPQGKFQEFLKLGGKERSGMLEEIFDLGKFNLFNKAQALIGKSLTRRSEIEGSLLTLGTIDLDKSQRLAQQIEEVLQSIALKTAEKISIDTQKGILDQLKKDIEEIAITRNKLNEIESGRGMIDQKRLQLEQYRIFVSVLKPVLDQQIALNAQFEGLSKSIMGKSEEQLVITDNQKKIVEQLQILTPDYEKRGVLLEKASDIDHLVEIRINHQKLLQFAQKAEHLSRDIASKKELHETQTEQLKGVEEKLGLLKGQLSDINSLNEAKSWHLVREKIVKEGKDKGASVKSLQDEILKLENEISSLIQDASVDSSSDIQLVFELLAKKIVEVKNQMQLMEQEISDLKLAQQLSKYADTLHDGKPCPLCGALEHPNIQVHDDVTLILKEKQSTQKNSSELVEMVTKLQIQLNGKHQQKTELLTKLEAAQNELAIQRQEFKEHEAAFVFDEKYKDKTLVESDIEAHKISSKAIIDFEKEVKTFRESLEKMVVEIGDFEKESHQITLQNTEFATIVKQRTDALKQLAVDEYSLTEEAELKKIGVGFVQEHQVIEKKFEQLNQELMSLNNRKSAVEGMLQELQIQIDNLSKQKSEVDLRLKDLHLMHPQITDEIVRLFTAYPLDVISEEHSIKLFDEQMISLKSTLQTLEKKSNKSVYDETQHQILINQLGLLTTQIQEETEHKGQLVNQLEVTTEALSKHQVLVTEFGQLENRINDLNKISKMFSGNKFVNYVSTYYLENLCKEANRRFVKLSNGHLELTLNVDNSFDVIDHLNNGHTRSSDSLSGGQTFQASLCLALALSDAINRKSHISQNFFFMDEGFGSLDNKSLHTVFQTLQSLRLENRIVGLISHVEEMKQEIPKCLVITNNDDRGSRIEYSWK